MKNKQAVKNRKLMGFLVLGIVAIFGVGMVMAYRGDLSAQGPNYSEDRHEAMQEAFDTLDYEAWVTLMTENGRHPRVVDVVTAENFETFVQAHEAMEDGNIDLAKELKAKLGLGQGKMAGNNQEGFKMSGSQKTQRMNYADCQLTNSETNCLLSNN